MMHYAVIIVLMHIVSLTVAKSANNRSSPLHSSVVEVTCILFSSIYECSDKINKTDELYKRYSDVCTHISPGARYIHNECTRNTMNEIVQYFEKQTVPSRGDNNITRWRHLKNNPKQIVNFVMSTMFSNRVYKRQIHKIQQAIQNVKLELRSGSISSTKPSNIPDDLILEFSCSVFSLARYCSHQLDHCYKRCRLLERVCTRLSFGSKLLSLSCRKDTVSAIASFLHSSDDKFVNVFSLWKEMSMESQRTNVDKLVKLLSITYYTFYKEGLASRIENNGTALSYSVLMHFFISLYSFLS